MKSEMELMGECLLLGRMIAGDEEAFTLLYRRKHPAIYRFALHMSGNAAVADDVTQEVFMTLIRDTTRFDPSKGTLGATSLALLETTCASGGSRIGASSRWRMAARISCTLSL